MRAAAHKLRQTRTFLELPSWNRSKVNEIPNEEIENQPSKKPFGRRTLCASVLFVLFIGLYPMDICSQPSNCKSFIKTIFFRIFISLNYAASQPMWFTGTDLLNQFVSKIVSTRKLSKLANPLVKPKTLCTSPEQFKIQSSNHLKRTASISIVSVGRWIAARAAIVKPPVNHDVCSFVSVKSWQSKFGNVTMVSSGWHLFAFI